MSILSLSTMWGIGRYDSLAELWIKARELGFTHLELNYQVTPDMLDAVLSLSKDGAGSSGLPIPISSVHAPCPWAEHRGTEVRRILLNAMDDELYRVVMSHHKASIDLAARLGAGVVVIHAGSVAPLEETERRLRALHGQGQANFTEYRDLWQQLVAQRAAMKAPYVERALASLRELAQHAQEQGVCLGLENRYYFFEIPDLDEMALFLEELGDGAGYWHDVGHAEDLARLGLAPHEVWLQRLGPKMLGVHLHDIDGLRDHRAPGRGSLDWEKLASFLPLTAIRVLEVNNEADEAQLRQGLTLLQKEGILAPITAINEEP